MSYDIVVRVAAEGESVIDRVERGLDDTTAAAGRTSAAVSSVADAASKAGAALAATAEGGSTSMDNARAAAVGTTTAVAGLAGAYETAIRTLDDYKAASRDAQSAYLNAAVPEGANSSERVDARANAYEALVRESEAYEALKGPRREYSSQMASLDAMLGKGTISTAEYLTEMDHLVQKYGTMQGPVQQVTEAMKNEEKILQSIRGPMQQYAADMDALDALFKRGAIDLDEMSKKAEQLASKAGTMHGPVQQQQAEAAPEIPKPTSTISDYVGALAVGGGLLAAGHQLADIVQTMHDIEDVSIKATNAAQKFVDAQHSATDIIREQLEVGEKLHASYETTIKLYDKVREGSEGVALSHREQLDMTKVLGEAVQLSNKPIESAAALMSRFSFAMQSGTIEGRALKSMMREVPAVADLWREAFHTNDLGLMDMVKHGKVTIADLVAAIANSGDKIDERFRKLQRTNAQAVDEYVERWKLAQTSVSDAFGSGKGPVEMINDLGGKVPTVASAFVEMMSKVDDVNAAAKRADQSFTHWLVTDGIKNMRSELSATAQITEGIANAIGRSAGVLKDPWDASGVGFGAQVAEMEKIKGPANEARVELDNLRVAMKSGTITAEEFRLKYRTLATTLNEGRLPAAIKLWEEFKLPFRTVREDMAGLNAILRDGVITWDQYIAKMREMQNSWTAGFGDLMDQHRPEYKPNSVKNDFAQHTAQSARETQQYEIGAPAIESARAYEQRLTDVDAAVKQLGLSQAAATVLQRQARDTFDSTAEALSKVTAKAYGYDQALARLKVQRDSGAIDWEQFQQGVGQLDRAAKLVEQTDEPMLAYQKRLKDITAGVHEFGITQSYANTLIHAAAEAYRAQMDALDPVTKLIDDLNAPLRAYNEQTRIANEAHAPGGISAEQYAHALDEVRLAYLGASAEGRTFSGGAEAAWIKLKIEADSFGASVATNLIGSVDKFNEAFVKAANDGSATWKSFGQAIGNVVDGIVQDLEKMLLKQIEVKAISALFSLGGSAVGAGAGGGSADSGALAGLGIEGYATGGQFAVGGNGGTDTTPVHFMATPGELVTVQTPAQQGVGAYPHAAGSSSAGAAAPAPIVNVRNVTVLDPSVIHDAMSGPAGEQIVLNHIKKNQGAIRPSR